MPSPSESIATKATELIGAIGENSRWLSAFSQRVEATAQQFRALGDLSSRGYEIIISIDTCELIDATGRAGRIAPGASDLTRRRVLADIGFSRAAMQTLPGSPFPFTILPGTVAEIILYLSKQYVRNAKFIAALQRTEIMEALDALGVDVSAEVVERIITAVDGLDIAMGAFAQHLIVTDEFVEIIEELLAHPKFVGSRELGLNEIELDHERYVEIFEAIMAVRARFPVNAVVDAVNLATAGALSETDDKRVVLHMTRSPSLHKLEKRGVILDMSVLLSDDAGVYPIICRPDAVWLFNRVIPTMPDGKIPYSVVETIYLSWMEVASHLRQIDHATLDQRKRWLEDPPFEIPEDSIFEDYLRLFIDSAIRTEQVADLGVDVLDREAQLRAIDAQDVESEAVLQQSRIKNLFRLLRIVRGGVEHAMVLVSGNADAIGRDDNDALSFLAEAGLPVARTHTDHVDESVIYHPASPDVVLVGCQLYWSEEGNVGCTVYWPTGCKRKKFQRTVGGLEPDTAFFALLDYEGGDIDYFEVSGAELEQGDPFREHRSDGYIQTVQLEGGSRTYTCELLLAGREAYTSIRFRVLPDDAVAHFYEATGGELPPILVTELIANSWRAFVNGNAS